MLLEAVVSLISLVHCQNVGDIKGGRVGFLRDGRVLSFPMASFQGNRDGRVQIEFSTLCDASRKEVVIPRLPSAMLQGIYLGCDWRALTVLFWDADYRNSGVAIPEVRLCCLDFLSLVPGPNWIVDGRQEWAKDPLTELGKKPDPTQGVRELMNSSTRLPRCIRTHFVDPFPDGVLELLEFRDEAKLTARHTWNVEPLTRALGQFGHGSEKVFPWVAVESVADEGVIVVFGGGGLAEIWRGDFLDNSTSEKAMKNLVAPFPYDSTKYSLSWCRLWTGATTLTTQSAIVKCANRLVLLSSIGNVEIFKIGKESADREIQFPFHKAQGLLKSGKSAFLVQLDGNAASVVLIDCCKETLELHPPRRVVIPTNSFHEAFRAIGTSVKPFELE